MKRILTILVAVCMLISLVPTVVFAEAENNVSTPTATTTKLYVSSGGNDSTVEGTQEEPYKTMEGAYKNLPAEGGEIVIMDDTDAFCDSFETNKLLGISNPALVKNGLVKVYGLKQKDGTYSKLNVRTGNAEDKNLSLYLGCDMEFSDIVLVDNAKKNIYVSAAFHELTIGKNVSVIGGSGADKLYSIEGGFRGSSISVAISDSESVTPINYADPEKGTTINIYSCKVHDVFAGGYAKNGAEDYITTGDCEINVYGGEIINRLADYPNADGYGKLFNANLEINIYGGTIATVTSYKYLVETQKKNVTLNIYNGAEANITTIGGVFAEDYSDTENKVEVNKGLTAAPVASDCKVAYCGVQNTAVNDDDKYSVRFIGTLSNLHCDNMGFIVTANGKNYSKSCTEVYSSLIANEGTYTKEYTADELGGNYIFAYSINNIPTSVGEVTFKVKPFIVVDGVFYYGTEYTVVYNAGAHVSSN